MHKPWYWDTLNSLIWFRWSQVCNQEEVDWSFKFYGALYWFWVHSRMAKLFRSKFVFSWNILFFLCQEELEVGVSEVFQPGSVLDMPQRPAWTYSMSKTELQAREEEYFQTYLKNIYSKYKTSQLSYFEHNLEVRVQSPHLRPFLSSFFYPKEERKVAWGRGQMFSKFSNFFSQRRSFWGYRPSRLRGLAMFQQRINCYQVHIQIWGNYTEPLL